MSELLLKMAMLAALTHGIRAASRIAGSRRGSLLLGLPSTTAVALVSCGQAYGIAGASEMAEASLYGLIAAVALSLAFARALSAGRRLLWSASAAVVAYLAVASGTWVVPEPGPAGRVILATLAVLAACRQAERMEQAPGRRGSGGTSPVRCLVLRTAVPVACLAAIAVLRESAGIRWAGLLSTFPGMTLAVLIVTYLESGPAEASSLARALPSANLGMIAFVAAFRFGCPAVGLGWGTAFGYLLASATLLAVGGWIPPTPSRMVWVRLAASGRLRRITVEPALWIAASRRRIHARARGTRPAPRPRRLSPLVEPIGL
jgi:hypothetical protein